MGRASVQGDCGVSIDYVGSWRWQVRQKRVITSSQVASLYGINPHEALLGVSPKRFSLAIHDADRDHYLRQIADAEATVRDMNFVYRVNQGNDTFLVRATGNCIRHVDGRPLEYLGAVHRVDLDDVIDVVSGHLTAAATALPKDYSPDLSFFIDMALVEAGHRLAVKITH